MPDVNPQFAEMMTGLRQKYLSQLKERRPEVAEFLNRCKNGQLGAQDLEQMKHHAHSLAGSGATYGFAEISQTGRALEKAINAGESVDTLIPLAQALFDECHKALTVTHDTHATVPASPLTTAAAPALKLLTADDDPAVRDLMTNLFKNDAKVLTAANGREALEIIRKERPDLVLLDDMMPEMTGMKLIETLQHEKALAGIAVIMLTASDRSKDVMRAIAAGAVDYITKPFDPEAVANKVRALLNRFGRTVLVADDDMSIRDLLAARFRSAGLRVLEARDGEEALRLAQAHKPQLALLDRMMPGLDGIALLQKLKANPETSGIPVIFLTAKRNEKDIVEGLKLGAVDYIVKPFSPEEVMTRSMRQLGLEKNA